MGAITLEDAMEALGYEPDQFSDYRVEADRVLMKLNRKPREVIIWTPDGGVEKTPSFSLTIAKGEELVKTAASDAISLADEKGVDLGYVEYDGKKLTKANVTAHIKAQEKRRAVKRAAMKAAAKA